MESNNRGAWGSNLGFLLATIGSAVGLGNIWGFPYKMGRSGGFAFLLAYLVLSLFVGFVLMCSELALGRRSGFGPIAAYKQYTKRFSGVGLLALIAPSLILTFYTVLGGYCIYYVIINFIGIFGTMPDSGSFGAMLSSPLVSVGMLLLFMVICFVINRGGISDGIEKFSKVSMPALFVMLVIIIIRAVTLPNAIEGIKFMFVPGYAVKAGFIEEAPSLISVLATAGGQMFFSLSLAMGIIITYGSYLSKEESLPKNGLVIVAADTLVALMAGLAVIPAAVANGINNGIPINEIKLSGPSLLFETLQDVFHNMGAIGGIFGAIFYLLVFIAAVTSAISLIEVIVTMFIDRNMAKEKESNRNKITFRVCAAVTIGGCLVAADGLGSNGIAPADLLGIPATAWNDCWLDFMDCWSEGLAMPIGAMIMSLIIGWEKGPRSLYDEIGRGSGVQFYRFYHVCIRYIVPVVMCFVSAGSIADFFGSQVMGYAIAGALLVIYWMMCRISSWVPEQNEIL